MCIFDTGLQEYSERACNTYSGGNKRKLSTAMAFINNPDVILLDEPTSGVDPVTRRNVWTVLKDCQNNKQTIIISSHRFVTLSNLCVILCKSLSQKTLVMTLYFYFLVWMNVKLFVTDLL